MVQSRSRKLSGLRSSIEKHFTEQGLVKIRKMKKNKIETGSIIKIPLEHNLGYVLAKFINLNEIKKDIGYNEFIYVYDRIFRDEDIVVNNIDDNDLLRGGVYVLNIYISSIKK